MVARLVVLGLIAALALGVTSDASSSVQSTAAEGVELTAVDIDFQPNEVTIPADTDVPLTITNTGAIDHTFVIDELGIDVTIAPGSSETITINAPMGEYEFYCRIPGHREAGQIGTMTVRSEQQEPVRGEDRPLAIATEPSVDADRERDLLATIAALQTQVAAQATELATLRDQGAPPTPTVAATVPALPTDAEEPIPLTDDFVLLYYYFVETPSDLYLFGEIQNVGERDLVAPFLIFTFLGEGGHIYGDDRVFPDGNWIPAGERMTFQTGRVLSGALGLGDWENEIVTAEAGRGTPEELDTSTIDLEGIPLEGPLGRLEGTIHNGGSEPVGPIAIRIAHYDGDGRFVGSCSGDYLDVSIPPGGSARVRIGGGDCGFTSAAKEGIGAEGPFTYRLIISRSPF